MTIITEIFNRIREIFPFWANRLHRDVCFYSKSRDISDVPIYDIDIAKYLLSNGQLDDITIVGTDGSNLQTSEYTRLYGIVNSANLVWSTRNQDYEVLTRYLESKQHEPSLISVEMTRQEMVTTACAIKAIKFNKFPCNDCPLTSTKCSMKLKQGFWSKFSGSRVVGMLDLAVDYSFIQRYGTISKQAQDILFESIRWLYSQIKDYDLDVIFITHSAKTKTILVEMNSDFEQILQRAGQEEYTFLEALVDLVRKEGGTGTNPTLLEEYKLNYERIIEEYTDFDLFRNIFTRKGASTDIYRITSLFAKRNYQGIPVGYQLINWGLIESHKNGEIYVPLDDIKLGYPLDRTIDIAYPLFLLETALGGGYSFTLTLAHSLASYIGSTRLLLRRYLADIHGLKKSLKEQLKWRYFQK